MKRLILALCLIAWSASAFAQTVSDRPTTEGLRLSAPTQPAQLIGGSDIELHPKIVHGLFVTMFVMAGADLAKTENCLGARTCHELNPALAPVKNPAGFGAYVIGQTAVIGLVSLAIHEAHPKIAGWILSGTSAAHGYGLYSARNIK